MSALLAVGLSLSLSACSSGGVTEPGADSGDDETPPGDVEEGEACEAHDDCVEGLYCALGEGCSGEGVCSEMPSTCPQIVEPVCGCDTKTYQNECAARASGVNVAHEGECEIEIPGCADSSDCNEGEICRSESCGERGVCEPLNTDCSGVGIPTSICSCEGRRYADVCELAEVGALLAPDADCDNPSRACRDNSECIEGLFCKKDRCNAEQGQCTERPEICITEPIDGVCGCDGEDYSSACAANAAGVNVSHAGSCRETRNCTPNNDGPAQCAADEYCATDPTAGDLNVCEGTGICEPKPDPRSCPDGPAEVCGCDGVIYNSECEANAAGVRVSNISSLCRDIGIPIDPPIRD